MELPDWGLAAAYWLHMLATVAWLGGLASLAIFVIPSARSTLESRQYAQFLGKVQGRIQQVGWFSLAVLTATGMFQMSAHPAYDGFLAIDSPWASAILAKHVVIGLMVITSAYMTWGLTPALRRLALLQSAGGQVDQAQQAALQRKEGLALRANMILSVVVLLLTALARAA